MGMNHHEPFLRTVFGFVGIDQKDIFVLPYSARSSEQALEVIAQSQKDMQKLVENI
jgi:FMN-dependent NADH-azoreductase